MLPTFVIGLREGVEAFLIVGIVAAFLRQEGRRDALRWMWAGVGLAIALCAGVGVTLELVSRNLPQAEQEALETVIGGVAVVAVTFMIVWMRRNARGLRRVLEDRASHALAQGSVVALVAMAFFAVVREGFETSVFLLAAFDSSTSPLAAGGGAVLGVVAAAAIGLGIYRGGVRLNLARFFRATGVVLVLVAAGLVSTSLHTAHEAGWLNSLQGQTVDLRWLVAHGSVRSSLLTGLFGFQPRPVTAEVLGYLLFAIPVAAYVLWPHGLRLRRQGLRVVVVAAAALAVAGCGGGGGGASTKEAGGRTIDVKLTDAGCEPADLRLTAGPATFQVVNDGADAVSEFELLDGGHILGEIENLTPGLSGHFSLTLKPGRYTTYCPGGDVERGSLVVTGSGLEASNEAVAAVAVYRRYVAQQTAQLVERTTRFVEALASGDLVAAQTSYVEARVPYERIEPVAESFGALDPAIDAREGDVTRTRWTGFHPIEKALWVTGTTAGTDALRAKLLRDVRALQRRARTVELQPAQIANGAVELLGEVSKSKITGEEERYSHTDLIDFEANVDGSKAAFDAVTPLVAAKDPALVAKIRGRFDGVYKALRPYRGGLGYVEYTKLTKQDTRTLSRAIDALAEPLSEVGAIVAAAR